MLKMRLEGMSYEAIGKKANICRQRVQQLLSPPAYIRKLVITRAEGKCQNCGISVERIGHVHHLGNSGEDYNDVANLIFLCPSCHRKVHENQTAQEIRLRGLKQYWRKKRPELRGG
jgi:5-methylcytosine-specific restriction endonuclease McrA